MDGGRGVATRWVGGEEGGSRIWRRRRGGGGGGRCFVLHPGVNAVGQCCHDRPDLSRGSGSRCVVDGCSSRNSLSVAAVKGGHRNVSDDQLLSTSCSSFYLLR